MIFWTILCIVTGLIELFRGKRLVKNGKIIPRNPTFGTNGRVRQYPSNYFHIAVQGLTRILQVSFIEVFLFILVNFGEFRGESKLSKVSMATTIVLTWVYSCFFLSYPIYRGLLQRSYTVKSKIGNPKLSKS